MDSHYITNEYARILTFVYLLFHEISVTLEMSRLYLIRFHLSPSTTVIQCLLERVASKRIIKTAEKQKHEYIERGKY